MGSSTRESILEAARDIAQTEGYAALSFRELASRVGIKSASVHYHFPTKGDLAGALVRRYREDAQAMLDGMAGGALARIRDYIAGFRLALEQDNKMCLCSVFGAERDHLPEQVRSELAAFVDANVVWLTGVLGEAEPDVPLGDRRQKALAIYTAIVGAQLAARTLNDTGIYDEAIRAYEAAGLLPPASSEVRGVPRR